MLGFAVQSLDVVLPVLEKLPTEAFLGRKIRLGVAAQLLSTRMEEPLS